MSRARPNELFDLIKSLTANEKRHLKLSELQKGEKNYALIFSAIDQMKVWDATILKEKVKDKIPPSSIARQKSYLYALILKSLRNYNEINSSLSRQLYNRLEEADILEKKGLYHQSERILEEIKSKAIKNDLYLIVLETLQRKARFILGFRVRNMEKTLDHWANLVKESLTLVEMEFHYSQLHYLSFLKMRIAKKEDKKELNKWVEQLIQDPWFKEPPKENATLLSKVFYHSLQANIAHYAQKVKKANKWYASAVTLFENYPSTLEAKYRNIYKLVLGNYLQSCHVLNSYDNFESGLKKIKSIKANNFDEAAEDFQNISSLELLYTMNTRQFDKAFQLIPNIREGIEKYKSKINLARKISIYYNILVLYFVTHNFEDSIHWIDKILYSEKDDPRKDIQSATKIFELIIHYENSNDKFFNHLVNRLAYRRKTNTDINPLEKPIIILIKKLFNTLNRKEKEKLFIDFMKILNGIKIKNEGKIHPIIEVELWCQSHITGNNMQELMSKNIPSN